MSERLSKTELGILLTYLILATLYSVTTPAWEAPDENMHFDYITHLLRTHTLPVQRIGEMREFHHPPLYYLLAAIAVLPADLNDPAGSLHYNPNFIGTSPPGQEVNLSLHTSGETFPYQGHALALHLARGVSVLMGMVTVHLTFLIGQSIFPQHPLVGLLATGLVAFNPQFLFISGSINNDNLLVMTATGTWWQLLKALKRPEEWRQWFYVGLWTAAAILTKMSALVAGAVAAVVMVLVAARRRSLKLLVRNALALGIPVLLLTGWWFVRNQILYGDPLGWRVFRQIYQGVFRTSPLQLGDLDDFFNTQIDSFWGVFGWSTVFAPAWFYAAVRVLGLLALFGLGYFALRYSNRLSNFQKGAIALLVLAVLAQEAYMLSAIRRLGESWYQGRYLFPIIGPAMVLTSTGVVYSLPKRLVVPLSGGLVLALVSVALFMPFYVIRPAFESVPLPKWKLWFVPNKTDYCFGDMFVLKGYAMPTTDPDESRVKLTLYWQGLKRPDFNYSVFVHLINEAGEMVAQKDHGPGADRGYPPKAWWPGDIVADDHVIEVPSHLKPGTYRFRVGVYRWDTGERLPVRRCPELRGSFERRLGELQDLMTSPAERLNDQLMNDHVVLGQVLQR